MSELPTGTVTLLLAGVDGSARYSARPSTLTAPEPLNRALADAAAAHSGVLAERSEKNGATLVFARASDAVACALDLQRTAWAPAKLRIGIHTGEIQLDERGGTAGETVTRAAWLRDLAHGGQTVLSGITGSLVADQLPRDAWLVDSGRYRPQVTAHPEHILQLCHPALANEFPPLRTGETVLSRNFPVPLTRFIGRRTELDQVRRLIDEHRLVTLTGSGGVGKTRLAVQLTSQLSGRFPDGVSYIDFVPVSDPDLVAVQAARTLGLPAHAGRSAADTLVRFLADRQMLLVFDTCEHLLDACASLAAFLLAAGPGLRIVATSREPLGVPGEATYLTPSLSLADEAIELFADRARLSRPDFAVTDDNAAVVAEICHRLDGVPLAIELAAARVRAMSPGEILDGLHDRFRLLTAGPRTAVPRQQTLHASVDWSHELLSPAERTLFRRLAVFVGSFDLAAAEAVAAGPDLQRYQVIDAISLLVDKSLVMADDGGHQTSRYRLLETMRQYAAEKLDAAGESAALRTRHRDHYTALFSGPVAADHQQRVERAEIEIGNLHAAFTWSRDNGDIELAAELTSSLQPLWLTQGRILQGLAWFDAVLADQRLGPAARARALADTVILNHVAGIFDCAGQAAQALEIASTLDDPDLLARALTACGVAWVFSGQIAGPYFTEAIELLRTLGDDWQLSWVLAWYADSSYTSGDPATTQTTAQEGRRLADAAGDPVLSRMCRWFMAMASWLYGDLPRATAELGNLVDEARAVQDSLWTVYGLFGLSKTLASQGKLEDAREAAESGIAAAADLTPIQQALTLGVLADTSLAAGDVEAAICACDAAWQACPQLFMAAVNGFPLVQVTLARGDMAAARRWADDVLPLASGVHRIILLAARIRVAIAQGDVDQADHDAHEALMLATQTKAYLMIPDVLECLAMLAGSCGNAREAAWLLGAAQAVRDHTGQVRSALYGEDYLTSVAKACEELGEQDFAAAHTEGASLPPDEAIHRVLRDRESRKRPATGWPSLTPSEQEITRLVSEGLSNKQIAARLFISPRTVQSHLTHIYAKLGVNSRTQLAHKVGQHN